MKTKNHLDRIGNLLIKDGRKNRRAIAAVYLVILSPILLLAGFSSFHSYRDLTSLVRTQNLHLAALAATTLKENFDRFAQLGISLASRVRFRQLIGEGRWVEAVQILQDVPRDFPFVERVFLTDPGGTLMADFPLLAGVRGTNFAARDWYRGVSREWKPYISNVYRRAAAPQYNVIAAAVPVGGTEGKPAAILVLQVKLESLLRWINDIDVGAQGAVFVVDKSGNLAVHPAINLQDDIRNLAALAPVYKALRGQRGVEALPDSAGADQLFAYHPVAGYGWAVVLQHSTSAAYALRDRTLAVELITYGLIVLLSVGLAYLVLSVLLRIKEVEDSRSQMAAIVESSDDAILSKTLDGTITTWNKGAKKIYGYDESEVIGRSVGVLIPPDKSGEMETLLEQIRRGEIVEHYETRRIKKNGRAIDVSLTVSPIKDSQGKIVAASAIARDITDRRRLRLELQEKNRLLEEQFQLVQEANRLKSEFLANMSHELRTPLNAIIGFTQLMHDGKVGPVSPEHQEYLGDILSSGRRLLELINDVLDLARVESGKMEFVPEAVKLSLVIDQICLMLRSAASGKQLALTSEVSPQVEDLVIDPAKLKQIIYNYLSNAIKFTPAGGAVSIRALPEDDDRFRLEVRDSGMGIAPERIGELFVEFKQLEAGLGKKHQGTGLGLALTKKIVEAQGGRVGVSSAVGAGSTFVAVLPKTALSAVEREAERAAADASAAHGPTILVVEDDENDLNWIKKILSSSGYSIDAARNGAEGLAKAQTTAYDAVLLDLILPDRLGWDVLQGIRSAEPNRNSPVIVLTVVSEKAEAKAFALQDYLIKPVSAGALLGALRRAGVIAHGGGKQILVVDDDPETIKLARAALESSGYQPICHTTGAAALAAASESVFDAIVIDLLMPEMDGFEFLERFRSLAHCRHVPVIVWTGKSITTEERKRLKGAVNSITLKAQGGIDAVLRELRYQVAERPQAAAPEVA
jgi:PAS domain S-box-containing protein